MNVCIQTESLSHNRLLDICCVKYITRLVNIVTVDVVIEVQSAKEGIFSVTCTARGGTVLNSSLTGPGTVPQELRPVGRVGLRGDDTYSITTPSLSRGANGDTYQCIATNGASTPDPSDSATLRGNCLYRYRYSYMNYVLQLLVLLPLS